MFEKYDGVRGFWNPLKKAFYSRKGNKLSLPQDIIDSMPTDLFLDGELWYGMNQFIFSNRLLWRFGRDNFQEAVKISNRVDASEIDWSKFKYMVYDVPTLKSSYAERYEALSELSLYHLSPLGQLHSLQLSYLVKGLQGKDYKYISLAKFEKCTDVYHMQQHFQDIIDQGGEGIILRDPASPYKAGSSAGYLKYKVRTFQPCEWPFCCNM